MRTKSFVLDVGKEDRLIHGVIHLPDHRGPHPVIVICHGFKGFRKWGFFPYTAETLAASDLAVITFNFSMNGVGEDGEAFTELHKFARNTYSREQEDLHVLFQQLNDGNVPFSEELDMKQTALLGHSRGGANSLLFAMDHPTIRGVALWNSVSRVDFFSDDLKQDILAKGTGTILNARTGQEMPISREVLDDIEANKKRFDLLGRLSEYKQPILILQAAQDPAVSVQTAKSIDQRAPRSQLHIIQEAGHTFNATHPFQESTPQLDEALQKTIHFFKQIFRTNF